MVDEPSQPEPSSRSSRPWLAALLSFVFPGLGQAYRDNRRAALVFAIPMLVLVIGVGSILTRVIEPPRNVLLSTGFLIAVLVVNGVIFAWRSASIAHAGLTPWTGIGPERRTSAMTVALLVLLTLAMHAWVGMVVVQLEGTLTRIFAGADPGVRLPVATSDPAASEAPGEPSPPPDYRWDGTDRINILLLGTDAAPGREAVLTDVILVVSIDPVDETAVMISIPRDTGYVPLADGSVHEDRIYPDKVNGLIARAQRSPDRWCPDLDEDEEASCGIRTIQETVGLYLGVEIHHHALVDMAGFADLIDALGGLELCLPGELVDPEFDGSLENEVVTEPLVLPAGCRQYNGLDALAYARSRKGWIELPDGTREPQNDFTRSDRQQLVLLALRRELAEADTFLELPGVLDAIGRTVSTDFPRDQAGDLASLVPVITGPDIDRLVLSHPEFLDLPLQPDVNYLLIPKREAIRDAMAELFGEDELTGWYLAGADRQGTDPQPSPP